MSRVHDALRRAAVVPEQAVPEQSAPIPARPSAPSAGAVTASAVASPPLETPTRARSLVGVLDRVRSVNYTPLKDSLLIDVTKPHQGPTEEFRSLRTRLNHMQTLQPIHSIVVTSASPAEGKSFTAANYAIAQSQLAGNPTVLCDFDFRRPMVHTFFQIDRSPGITDYLLGKAELEEVIVRIQDTNLYLMPAGEAVINPLELLNLDEVKTLIDDLPGLFNWVVMDTPPLLFAADANLLSTMSHGTILVVRIGNTTIDSVTRAMQSLCQNNVLGIVVNGARRGELYSKYTYYHSYYDGADPAQASEQVTPEDE